MASRLMDDPSGQNVPGASRPSGASLAARAVYLQLGFVVIVALGCFGGAGSIMNLAFTPMALALGFYLAITYVPQYLSFTIWLWMLTPFVRRLVDMSSGYHDQSIVMLAPFLVSGIAVISLPRFLLSEKKVVIIYGGILYPILGAFVLGVLQAGFASAAFGLLTWLTPVLVAILILAMPDLIEDNAEAVFKAFGYGALVMGAYGIYQFFVFPEWDSKWIINSGMTTLGSAANGVRIFSTMNSPGIFALMLGTGLLANLVIKTPLKPLTFALGLTAFMLSLVRSAWGGFIVALVFIMMTASVKTRARYLIVFGLFGAASLPLLMMEPIAGPVQKRLESLSDTENDTSYGDRVKLYNKYVDEALTKVVGNGLGNTGVAAKLSGDAAISFDNGILDNFLTFGILSLVLIPALFGMAGLAVMSFRLGPYANASAAIAVMMISELPFGNVVYAPVGIITFIFPAIAITYGVQDRRRKAAMLLDGPSPGPQASAGGAM